MCIRDRSNGESPLMLQVSKGGKRQYQSLGVSVNPKFWDFSKNKPTVSYTHLDVYKRQGYIGSYTTDNDWYYQSFFADTDFINLYLCAILVTLSNRSESYLRIRLLQNDFRIYFHFYRAYLSAKLRPGYGSAGV